MEPKDTNRYQSTPLEITIQSWNQHTTLPVTLSVICPQILLDDVGKRLQIELHSIMLSAKVADTHVLSIPIGRPFKAFSDIKSFFFSFQSDDADCGTKKANSESCVAPNIDANVNDTEAESSLDYCESTNSPTRIRVPNDVVKVEDRLGYILQPPIETWLGRRLLETPFEPFNYQKQGVAFLYGAHHAILADEMGLGKTMQAITTIRLLFRSGECRRVLLVCPKPLVTN